MGRGYCGIGVLNMKSSINYGTLFRSALCFRADFIYLIGKRFKNQCSDTVKAYRHLPLFEYESFDDFHSHLPYDCRLVGVEISDGAKDISKFTHPERACYLLGAEDSGISGAILSKCCVVVKIPTDYCLNVAVAGSIILYDRLIAGY